MHAFLSGCFYNSHSHSLIVRLFVVPVDASYGVHGVRRH